MGRPGAARVVPQRTHCRSSARIDLGKVQISGNTMRVDLSSRRSLCPSFVDAISFFLSILFISFFEKTSFGRVDLFVQYCLGVVDSSQRVLCCGKTLVRLQKHGVSQSARATCGAR